jgi:phospholipid/cholesterol/gamma-HCH transport system substrate-binding protein
VSKEFKVGLFAVIIGIILYLGFNFLKGIEIFSNTNKYYALYSNVDGLNVSNPVIINGFSVGRVSKISILQNRGNMVMVEMTVAEDIVLSDSTIATLTNSDFLGSKAITLTIGDISKPKIDGDTLVSAIDKGLAEILERAQPLTDNLGLTISRVNEILLGLEGAGEDIKETINSFNKTLIGVNKLISENSGSIKGTLSNFENLSKNLNKKLNKLDPVIVKADSALAKINKLEIERTLNTLDKLLKNLSKTVEAINTGKGSLGKMIKEDSLYNNLNKTLLDLDKLLIHFNENPRHFMSPLGKKKKKIEKELKAGN